MGKYKDNTFGKGINCHGHAYSFKKAVMMITPKEIRESFLLLKIIIGM